MRNGVWLNSLDQVLLKCMGIFFSAPQVFPKITRWCEGVRMQFVPIDLRWVSELFTDMHRILNDALSTS